MDTANGLRSPSTLPTNPSPTTGKRKRTAISCEVDGSTSPSQHNNAVNKDQEATVIHRLLEDILVVLERSVAPVEAVLDPLLHRFHQEPLTGSPQYSHEIFPSIVQRPIALRSDIDLGAKRVKLSEPDSPTTVASQITARAYCTMDQFIEDMDNSISGFIKEMKETADADSGQLGNQEHARFKISQAKALKRELGELLLREMTIRPKLFKRDNEGATVKKDPDESNAADTQGTESLKVSSNKAALTLYGSAPNLNPRQLFSSLQQPIANRNSRAFYGKTEWSLHSPLRESALPNGITTTDIVPVHSHVVRPEKKNASTLGELVPRPLSLAQLNPPKQSRHTATRSSSVNWYNASESTPSTRSYRRDNYSTQSMGTGQWLTYNVAPSASRMSSPEAKRKQRDRALSFGESQAALPQETVDAHNQAKDEALFKSAFSSFAPARDNTGATVNARTKDSVWWERVGESRHHNALTLIEDEIGEDSQSATDGISEQDADLEMKLFEEAVASWVPEELPAELKETEKTAKEPATAQEVDEILKEISELLETLNSYQRVRNLSLATNARTIAGQNPQLTAMSGTPSSPSSAEFDIYEILKSQLAVMVSLLPPFAVARLDGDKLAALNVNTRIQVEGKTSKGTMEEDDISLKARQVANPAAYPRSSNASSSLPARSNPYASTPIQQMQRSSNYTTQSPASKPSSNYLPNQQYSNRPISSQYYGNASSSISTQQRAPVSSDRYSYATSQQYGPQGSRTTNGGYANGYRTSTTQSGASYSQQYTTPSQGSTNSVSYSQSQRPSQPGYQQRAMNSQAYAYTNASAATGRSNSPQQSASAYTQQRSSYAANNPTPSQPRPAMYQSQSSQYSGQPASSQQVNGTGTEGPSSQQAHMTANEPAAFINRQKANLAEQQRQTPTRHTSSTPQPGNSSCAGQSNGIPTPQPNGVAVGQGE